MPTIDLRIDEYIIKSADFAKPILTYLRALVHTACPEVKEAIKWGCPHFEYADNILCSMAAFKQHCAFAFWLASLMQDPDKILEAGKKKSMGHIGAIKSLNDLPPDNVLIKYIEAAMALIEKGVKPKKEKSAASKEIQIPSYFLDALKQNNKALTTFENFSSSNKKEYLEWITEAKTEATRTKRIAAAIEWLQEGKSRNWKYM